MTDDAAYTDFLGGRVTFTQTDESVVRMTGQLKDGFEDPNADYRLHIEGFAPVAIPVGEPPGSPASGPGSTPTSCARDGTAREWALGKLFVKGLPRVA
ncbi:hypothetical protein [Streptomyces vinaceus]|uniref:hypothetical protein n=1 Tax=Streptomyces vinaceus TaxID=1960 RepID=UPI0036BAFB9C